MFLGSRPKQLQPGPPTSSTCLEHDLKERTWQVAEGGFVWRGGKMARVDAKHTEIGKSDRNERERINLRRQSLITSVMRLRLQHWSREHVPGRVHATKRYSIVVHRPRLALPTTHWESPLTIYLCWSSSGRQRPPKIRGGW